MRNAHASQDVLGTFVAAREFFCQRVFLDKFSFCKEAVGTCGQFQYASCVASFFVLEKASISGLEIDCISHVFCGFLSVNEEGFCPVCFVTYCSSSQIRTTKMTTKTKLNTMTNFVVDGACSHDHFEKMFVAEAMGSFFRSSL